MIDFKKELNSEQYAAVASTGDRALVLAGAGSGKTRTLTYRVAWLLGQGVKPWRILLLTFTNKAAKEMLDRVEALTGTGRGEIWGGTFHSIALRILRKNPVEAGLRENFTILDAGDAEKLFSSIVKKISPETFKDGRRSVRPALFYAALSYMRNTQGNFEGTAGSFFPWLGAQGAAVLKKSAEIYAVEKRAQNVVDFDDILELCVRLLNAFPQIRDYYRQKFQHILVDEFQDTNAVQTQFIDALAGAQTRLMAVGDDAQCIYTWRGASYENIVRFPKTRAGTQVFKVETNYRSTPEILAFANSVLEARREPEAFEKSLKSIREPGEKPLVVPVLNSFDQGEFVAQKIKSLIWDYGVSPDEIAVLYRAHRHAKELQMSLRKTGVPFVVTSGVQFFEQAHLRDFTAILKFLTNPFDFTSFQRIVTMMDKIGNAAATRIFKKSCELAGKNRSHIFREMLSESVQKSVPAPAADDFRDFVLTLQNMYEALTGTNLENASMPDVPDGAPVPAGNVEEADLFDDDEPGGNASGDDGGLRTELDVLSPAQVVQIGIEGWYGDFLKRIYSDWRERYDDLVSLVAFADNFDSLGEMLSQAGLMDSSTTGRDVGSRERASREPSVLLSTVHQAKGLEFPYVFILSCSEEMFPTKRAVEENNIDEERRLFYVAATRAKDSLTMVYVIEPEIFAGTINAELSRFISCADKNTYQKSSGIVHYGKFSGF